MVVESNLPKKRFKNKNHWLSVDDGEEPTDLFVLLEKRTKPVKESNGHLLWTSVRLTPGPLDSPLLEGNIFCNL